MTTGTKKVCHCGTVIQRLQGEPDHDECFTCRNQIPMFPMPMAAPLTRVPDVVDMKKAEGKK